MDTLTAEKLEYLLSGYKVTMEDRDGIIDLMEGYAKQEVERAKVFSSNAVLAVTSDSKENEEESEEAVCVVDGCKEVGYMGKYCHKHFYEMGKTQTGR